MQQRGLRHLPDADLVKYSLNKGEWAAMLKALQAVHLWGLFFFLKDILNIRKLYPAEGPYQPKRDPSVSKAYMVDIDTCEILRGEMKSRRFRGGEL